MHLKITTSCMLLHKVNTLPFRFSVEIPSSKSMSNRALILHKLSGEKITVQHLSEARDTKILWELLSSNSEVLDAQDAGTTLRFLTAYCCAVNRKSIITGTERMKSRPVKPLVDALCAIGFSVRYLEKDGFPPLQILPIENSSALRSEVEIDASVSSQFISALMMIAPVLPAGLTIRWKGAAVSEPYLQLTHYMLKQCKVNITMNANSITIAPALFAPVNFSIEADWSNAYYWIALVALLPNSKMLLKHVQLKSLQGDAQAAKLLSMFGVHAEQLPNGLSIENTGFSFPKTVSVNLNFMAHPDLAQTFMVLCAAKNIQARFSGLSTLAIKETNRIEAMQAELKKCGVALVQTDSDMYELQGEFVQPQEPICTYKDHRMAMSFAPLAALGMVEIEEPEVVEKSYPNFWKQWALLYS